MQYDKDMMSDQHDLFMEIRSLLLSYNLIERKKERITTYGDTNGGICHMRTMVHGVDLGFLKGAIFHDKYQRLTGKGKKIRVLKTKAFDREILSFYIEEAIKKNCK